MAEAKKAIQASLDLHYDSELAAVAHSIFGDELRPSQTKSKSTHTKSSTSSQTKPKLTWVSPVLLFLFAGWVLYMAMNGPSPTPPAPTPPAPTPPAPTPMLTRTVAATPSSGGVATGDWAQFISQAGLVKFEYPTSWRIQRDTEESIEFLGADTALTFFVMPGNTESDIAAIISYGSQDPDFADTYNELLRDYLETEFRRFSGGLIRLGNPVIKEIGEYSTISNDVEYFESSFGVTKTKRMWIYLFDCSAHLCQVMYAKNGSSAFTEEQQRVVEHMIASLRVNDAQPAPVPDALLSLSFCYEHEFGKLIKKCNRHQTFFTGTVERLYVSWTPSEKYKGASFLRKWYIDESFILESESTDEYAYIEVDTRTSLKPGKYSVDVYVDDTLVARGEFEIR